MGGREMGTGGNPASAAGAGAGLTLREVIVVPVSEGSDIVESECSVDQTKSKNEQE
jgi:hypothetical protein